MIFVIRILVPLEGNSLFDGVNEKALRKGYGGHKAN